MLARLQGLESLQGAARALERHFAFAHAIERQHLAQNKREARGHRVNRERLASEIGVSLDLGENDKAQKAVVSAHEGKQVRLALDRLLALSFRIGDDIVEGGEPDVPFAGDEAGELLDRIRGIGEIELDIACPQEAMRHRGPQWKVEAAGKDDCADALNGHEFPPD